MRKMSRLESDLFNYNSKYEKNDVLINKLNITDFSELEKAERMITTRKLAKLYLNPGNQTFDVKHYLSIHKYLFEDIYDFAGEIRNESITKPIPFHEDEHIPFCLPQFIYSELKRVLEESNAKIKYIDTKDKLVMHIAVLYSDLDIIHPFREGNGRTLREFIRQYMEYICKINKMDNYYLDYSNIDRNQYLSAVIKADTLLDYNEIVDLFNSILRVSNTNKNGKVI